MRQRDRVDGPMTLVGYDAAWPDRFAGEKRRICEALGSRALLVEHVGSTSVPGLLSKPIIDVVCAVADSADEVAYVADLEAVGYLLVLREPDWYEHRLFRSTTSRVNLHVLTVGSPEVDRMLAFRDWLRHNAADFDLYARTKRRLAARHWRFVQDYADAKSQVIEEIIGRAQVGLRHSDTTRRENC